MKKLLCCLVMFGLALAATPLAAADLVVPEGFTPLFNGKDLSGFRALGHYRSEGLPETRRERASGTRREEHGGVQEALDGRERRTGQRRQRPVCHDDQGLRRFRASDRVQDRARRPTAASTSAGRPRCRSGTRPRRAASGTSAPTRAPGPCGTTRARASCRWCWPTSRSASGTRCGSRWSARTSPSTSTTSWWSTTRRLENFWEPGKPVYDTGPIQLQTHGGEIRWRNIFIREIPRK